MLGAIGALEARHVSVVHGQPLEWSLVLATTTPRWLLLAAALPFVLHLATRIPLVPVRSRVVILHLVAFLALSWAQAAVDTWASGQLQPGVVFLFSWSARVTRSWYNTLPMMVSAYVAVLVAAWGIGEARERERRTLRASQLEAQLQSARLASLRAQLQPHFLYNTLTGIAALVADVQPARAVAAIEQLGELLHASLRDDGREEITVAEEVALAERYLALQGMRFGERLRYDRVIAPGVAECLVPVLLLQPIVENAVLHGLDSGEGTVHVTIDAALRGDEVELVVENDGSTLDADGSRAGGHGVGL
ncbi:MAG: histidine kinase, partial [Cytophagaceae bacterium]|nr:histidine kinase [Gemmatimonadaceae bacterium]